ncbi:MAG: hypothetical protein ACSW8H_00060 [bacterium]
MKEIRKVGDPITWNSKSGQMRGTVISVAVVYRARIDGSVKDVIVSERLYDKSNK